MHTGQQQNLRKKKKKIAWIVFILNAIILRYNRTGSFEWRILHRKSITIAYGEFSFWQQENNILLFVYRFWMKLKGYCDLWI